MKKSNIIIFSTLFILAIFTGIGFWKWESHKNADLNQKNIQFMKNTDLLKEENSNLTNQESIVEVKPPNTEDWRTAEWNTYRDEKNGFEIEYPGSHFLDKNLRQSYFEEGDVYLRHSDTVRYRKEMSGPTDVPETYLVKISVRNNNDKLSLIDWFKKNDASYLDYKKGIEKDGGNDDYKARQYELNGERVLLFSEPSIMDNQSVCFDLGNKVAVFHAEGLSLETNNGDNFFKKIVESFRIIK